MKREQWRSRLGFIWAAAGSAVGLGNIWRFPYVVGEGGGAAFILVYVLCLILVGLPLLIAEITIGRKTRLSPGGAFAQLGRNTIWRRFGRMTVFTGLIVASFYSVISGWTLGYLIQAIGGKLTHFETASAANHYFQALSGSAWWSVTFHLAFMSISTAVLYAGVQRGIESWNKVLMPLLFIVLIALAIKGLMLTSTAEALQFLFAPKWSVLTPKAVLIALGQAFFALSLGQGTMVTYGSYLSEKENVPSSSVPIASFGLIVSLLAGIAIFTIVFSAGLSPNAGPSLMYETLPLVFSQISGGWWLAVAFFSLVFMAALTSQISAMEPMIAHLRERFNWSRHIATLTCASLAFVIGIPSALAFGAWSEVTLWGMNLFDLTSSLAVNILIPLGGLMAAILVGWRWGLKPALQHLTLGAEDYVKRYRIFMRYLGIGIRYIAPIAIIIILINSLF